MCRMLGVISTNKISPLWLESFQELAVRGRIKNTMSEGHYDGWGVAGYLGKWAVHFGRSEKSAISDSDNFLIATEKAMMSSTKILIAHLRKASEGDKIIENTHPFIKDDWIFCHNGTIYNSERLLMPGCKYEGTTDSERFFKFLIDRLDKKSVKDYKETIRDVISEIESKCKFTSLTFLLSDGKNMYCYRGFAEDENYYTLNYSFYKGLFLVCSEELRGFEWKEMKNGEIVVVNKYGLIENESEEVCKKIFLCSFKY
ncbi:MAG: class II glutamine amidotransferase [Elusimicrobia bacterium]|nr:class II glutamine amidotransferase [Elusimicrobiota bacterium]